MPRSWSDVRASALATRSVNPIRQLVEGLQLQPNPEKEMIALSIGDPTIFGNLQPPESLIEALNDALMSKRFNGYANSTGHEEAKAAVAKYSSYGNVEVKPQDVILCSGCSSSLDMCISVLADPGQNILIPKPGFPLYQTLTHGLGIKTKYYTLQPDRNWEVDLDDLERQIDEQTAAIIVNNPSNPCGSVYGRDHLQDILEIASRYCIPIIADEIYEHIVFDDEEFIPMASLSIDVPILSCSGLAKRFLVPGWRMGWIIIHDRNNIFGKSVRTGLQKFSQRTIGSSTLIQGALHNILLKTSDKFFYETISVLETNAHLLYSRLSRIKGLKPLMPKGAMYMMVRIELSKFPSFRNDVEFVKSLVSEESCFCLPGECFGAPGYIRITLSPPREMLEAACLRIRDFCIRHYKSKGSVQCIYNIQSPNIIIK